MKSNNTYNLMMQLTQEAKSLWRIKDQYMKDAEGHDACLAFWEKMVADKEAHIAELEALVKADLG